MLRSLRLLLAVAALGAVLGAQEALFWEGESALHRLGNGVWKAEPAAPSGTKATVPLRADFKLEHPVRFQGRFWANRLLRTPGKGSQEQRTLSLMHSADGQTWEVFGSFALQGHQAHPRPSCFLPLDDGRALGVSSLFGPFSDGKDHSRFAVFRRIRRNGDPALELERVIPMELPATRDGSNPLDGLGLFFMVQERPLAEGWALVHPRSGLVWAVWLEEGRLRHRLTAVYPRILEDLANGTPFETALLAVHPQADGSLLAAARSEAATLVTHPATQGRQDIPDLPQGTPLTAEAVLKHLRDVGPILDRVHEDQERRHWRDFPELRWFRIDPKAGKAEEVLPEGAPTRLPPEPPFSFTLDARGRVALERPAPAASDGPEAQARP